MLAWLDQIDRAIRGYHIPSSHVKGSHRGVGIFGTLSGANMLRDILQKELERRKNNVARVCSVSLHDRWHDSLVKKSPNKRPRPWPRERRKKRLKKHLQARSRPVPVRRHRKPWIRYKRRCWCVDDTNDPHGRPQILGTGLFAIKNPYTDLSNKRRHDESYGSD